MKQSSAEKALATLAVNKGFLTPPQIREAVRLQILCRKGLHQEVPLAVVFLLTGALELEQLQQLQEELDGELALHPISRQTSLGEVLVENEFITPEQLFEAIEHEEDERRKGNPPRLLGDVLVEMGVLTPERLLEGQRLSYEINRRRRQELDPPLQSSTQG